MRIVWDEQEQKYYFSTVDVVQVLTEQPTARGASTYWAVLKKRLKEEGMQFASLTDILTKAWSGRTTRQYKQLKGLRKESLRDNMTNVELALNTLAEASATELSKQRNPQGFDENAHVANEGGKVAKVARQQLEQSLGRSVVTAQKASDYIRPIEQAKAQELPLNDDSEEKKE